MNKEEKRLLNPIVALEVRERANLSRDNCHRNLVLAERCRRYLSLSAFQWRIPKFIKQTLYLLLAQYPFDVPSGYFVSILATYGYARNTN